MNLFWIAMPEAVAAQDGLLKAFEKLGKIRLSLGDIKDLSWADMTIKQRITVYDWTLEACVLATFVVYLLTYWYGRKVNRSMVSKLFDGIKPVLDYQFGVVGCSPSQEVIRDCETRYTTYASGRLNVESVLIRFRLKERQSLMTTIAALVVPGMASADGLGDHAEITITPTNPSEVEPAIFGVINKEVLTEVQEKFYFEKFAKITDSDVLPSNLYTFLLEHSDLLSLYTPEFQEALTLPGASEVFRSLVFSDLPDDEPEKVADVSGAPSIRLSLSIPSSQEGIEAFAKILNASIDLVDVIVEKKFYRQTTLKRVKTTREAEVRRIVKAEEAVKKEELEAKRAEERREAARRESTLSDKEQRKLQKKENEKKARKERKKMTRRS